MNNTQPKTAYETGIEKDSVEQKLQWYYKGWVIVIAIFCFGPLGLIPLWFRPRTRAWVKISVSAVVIALTIWMIRETAEVYKGMLDYYEKLGQVMQDM
ncbi:MAG: hypothetical protein PVH45_01390 [Candidatus Omnitrophota bacterium]|jgi:hypothetical protein